MLRRLRHFIMTQKTTKATMFLLELKQLNPSLEGSSLIFCKTAWIIEAFTISKKELLDIRLPKGAKFAEDINVVNGIAIIKCKGYLYILHCKLSS